MALLSKIVAQAPAFTRSLRAVPLGTLGAVRLSSHDSDNGDGTTTTDPTTLLANVARSLADLASKVATKDDMAALRREVKDEVAALSKDMVALSKDMVTKQDLATSLGHVHKAAASSSYMDCLRALRGAYAATPFYNQAAGQVDMQALPEEGLQLRRTLTSLKDLVLAGPSEQQEMMWRSPFGLALAVLASSGQLQRWPFDAAAAPRSLVRASDLCAGQKELKLFMLGRMLVSPVDAEVLVGEYIPTADGLLEAKEQLQLALSLIAWGVRTAAGAPDLPVHRKAQLWLPAGELPSDWKGVHLLADGTPVYIHTL